MGNIEGLDKELDLAVGELWWDGELKASADDLLVGVQHFLPQSRKRLVGAWRCMELGTGWNG